MAPNDLPYVIQHRAHPILPKPVLQKECITVELSYDVILYFPATLHFFPVLRTINGTLIALTCPRILQAMRRASSPLTPVE
jgi:hypothetical protein